MAGWTVTYFGLGWRVGKYFVLVGRYRVSVCLLDLVFSLKSLGMPTAKIKHRVNEAQVMVIYLLGSYSPWMHI